MRRQCTDFPYTPQPVILRFNTFYWCGAFVTINEQILRDYELKSTLYPYVPSFYRMFFVSSKILSRAGFILSPQAPPGCENFLRLSLLWWSWQFWGLRSDILWYIFQFELIWYFSHDWTRVLGVWEEDQSGKVPFSIRSYQGYIL